MLQSQDNIAFIDAQKAAITEQLAAAKRNFEVGTATITDTHEAQARYDLAVAQEIAEQNSSTSACARWKNSSASRPARSTRWSTSTAADRPSPAASTSGPKRAAEGNLQAEIQRIAKTIADQEVERNRAGHYPTLDAVAGYTINNNQNFGATQIDTRTASVGLELNLPIYQGGLTSSRVREAVANQEKARQDLEVATREAGLQARQAWLNVNSGVARVRALEQALISTKAQLDSTKLGLEVGVRTNLDVLNAEQQVLSARRDLAGARYAYLLSGLSLKAAVGTPQPGRPGRDRPVPASASSGAISSSATSAHGHQPATRAAAPRWRAAKARPASPMRARAGASFSSLQRIRHQARRHRSPAAPRPASIASRVASSKLKVCGPTSTGRPTLAASIRFCPPSGSRLPPTKATSHAA